MFRLTSTLLAQQDVSINDTVGRLQLSPALRTDGAIRMIVFAIYEDSTGLYFPLALSAHVLFNSIFIDDRVSSVFSSFWE